MLAHEGPFPRFDTKKRLVGYGDILELFQDWPRFRGELARLEHRDPDGSADAMAFHNR
jgi:hypothetical protein